MDTAFWLERWQRNEIGFHQPEFNAHLQAFWPGLGLAPGAGVFVPLCGKSRDLLWLRAQGHAVIGVELSPVAVADFFRENALTPTVTAAGPLQRWEADGLAILCGDFFALTPELLRDVAGVFDRAALIALPPAMRRPYADHLARVLPAAAMSLLVTMEYPQGEMQGPPFSVSEAEVDTLFGASYRVERRYEQDILRENPRFAARGLSALAEKVYCLRRR